MRFAYYSLAFLVGSLLFSFHSNAEESTPSVPSVPSTDITVLAFDVDDELISVDTTSAVEALHYAGYDNQPHFSKDGKQLYFTRMLGEQTDIFVYRFDQQKLENVTNTLDISEYSPTVYDDSSLSVIGVNPEGKQHLRLINLDSGNQTVLNPAIEPVGYHAWLNLELAAVFVLGDVMTLQLFDIHSDSESEPLAQNIGRCLQTLEQNKASFTQLIDGRHQLLTVNHDGSLEPTGIVLPEGVQDYVWWDSEGVLVGQNSQLWYISSTDKKQIVDLQQLGINNITRLAIHNNEQKLAIVHE